MGERQRIASLGGLANSEKLKLALVPEFTVSKQPFVRDFFSSRFHIVMKLFFFEI